MTTLIFPTNVEDQNDVAHAPEQLNNGDNDMAAVAIPTTADPQFAREPFTDDIFSFDMDCINDAWLNQHLPDLDFSEPIAAF